MHALDRAIEIALEAHAGQTDKAGELYYLHCNRVAAAVASVDEKIVAYLHDVVEKGPGWSFDRLKTEGFTDAVVSAVDALTKREGESDETFVRRAASNSLAKPVKRADLNDNLAQASASGLDTSKYVEGLTILDKIATSEFPEAAGHSRGQSPQSAY